MVPVIMEVQLRGIEANKASEVVKTGDEVVFSVNSTISEAAREVGLVTLKFTVNMETEPMAANLYVSGNAFLRGAKEEIAQLLGSKEKDGTPTVFMKIYRQIYPTLYLVCGSLDIPYPLPSLFKTNSIATEEAAAGLSDLR